jgi:hypothetical protein
MQVHGEGTHACMVELNAGCLLKKASMRHGQCKGERDRSRGKEIRDRKNNVVGAYSE